MRSLTTSISSPHAPAEGRDAGSWSRRIWEDTGENAVKVTVWKANLGRYVYPPRPLEETFVVAEGEAICSLDNAEERMISTGSIVCIPRGVSITLEVTKNLRKVAIVVPKP